MVQRRRPLEGREEEGGRWSGDEGVGGRVREKGREV